MPCPCEIITTVYCHHRYSVGGPVILGQLLIFEGKEGLEICKVSVQQPLCRLGKLVSKLLPHLLRVAARDNKLWVCSRWRSTTTAWSALNADRKLANHR